MFELNEIEISRFHSNVNKKNEDECWNWTGYKQKSGHGQLRMRQQNFYAHRIAYIITNGQYNENLCVCHKCDNPACCNPKHLFLGTMSDNMKDKVIKNRQSKGTEVSGILTEQEVLEIKRIYADGNTTQTLLGRKYGVTQSTIGRIISGHRWGHLSAPSGLETASK
jgi:DNA-binding XRE family transcriptional regulator